MNFGRITEYKDIRIESDKLKELLLLLLLLIKRSRFNFFKNILIYYLLNEYLVNLKKSFGTNKKRCIWIVSVASEHILSEFFDIYRTEQK